MSNIDSPHYYADSEIECIDAIQASMTPEQFKGYLKGTIIKYTWRAGKKDNAREDVMKAIWFANKLKSVLDK